MPIGSDGTASVVVPMRGTYEMVATAEGVFNACSWGQSTGESARTVELIVVPSIEIRLVGQRSALITAIATVPHPASPVATLPIMRQQDGSWRMTGPVILPLRIELHTAQADLPPVSIDVCSAESVVTLEDLIAIAVHVTDAVSGAPLVDARVFGYSDANAARLRCEAISGRDGTATLLMSQTSVGMARSGFAANVAVVADGYSPWVMDTTVCVEQRIEVGLLPIGRPGGQLRDHHDNPLVGSRVFLVARNLVLASALTDESGWFCLLPTKSLSASEDARKAPLALREWGCLLYVETASGASGLLPARDWNQLVARTWKNHITERLERIRVVEKDSGRPVAAAQIRLVPRVGVDALEHLRGTLETKTDSDGRATFHLIAGSAWCAMVRGKDQSDWRRYDVDFSGADEQTIRTEADTRLVLHCTTRDGASAARVHVFCRGTDWQVKSGMTDSDGAVSFSLLRDRDYVVWVVSQEFELDNRNELKVHFDRAVQELVVLRKRALDLQILDASGADAAEALVALRTGKSHVAERVMRWARNSRVESNEALHCGTVMVAGCMPEDFVVPIGETDGLPLRVTTRQGWIVSLVPQFPAEPTLKIEFSMIRMSGANIGPTDTRAYVTDPFRWSMLAISGERCICGPLTPGRYAVRVLRVDGTCLKRIECDITSDMDLGVVE